MESARAANANAPDAPRRGNRSAPPKGGDGSLGAAGNVGGYNSGWLDPGSAYTVDRRRKPASLARRSCRRPRSSINRRRARSACGRSMPRRDFRRARKATIRVLKRAPGAYDDPERRPLGERCLLGFGSTSVRRCCRIISTTICTRSCRLRDSIMILTEMVHDARIVRMNAQHLPTSPP